MINLTDEQKAKFAERIQTPANNAMIRSALMLKKEKIEITSPDDFEVTDIGACDSDSISVAVRNPYINADAKEIFVSYIENGTIHIKKATETFLATDMKWTHPNWLESTDTGIEAEKASIIFNGTVGVNRFGEQDLACDLQPHIIYIRNGELHDYYDGTDVLIDTDVTEVAPIQLFNMDHGQMYKNGFSVAVFYVRSYQYDYDSNIYPVIGYACLLQTGQWTAPRYLTYLRTWSGDYQSLKSLKNLSIGASVNSVLHLIAKVGTTSGAERIGYIQIVCEYWSSPTDPIILLSQTITQDAYLPTVDSIIAYREQFSRDITVKSDIQVYAESGTDPEWTPSNFGSYSYSTRSYIDICAAANTIYSNNQEDPAKMSALLTDVRTHNALADDKQLNLVIVQNGMLKYCRFRYAMDVSSIMTSWDTGLKSDESVREINIELSNVAYAMFESDASVFNPGTKIQLYAIIGDTPAILLATSYIDEVKFSDSSESVSIASRDPSGFFLKDSKIDFPVVSTAKSATYYTHLIDILSKNSVGDTYGSGVTPIELYTFQDANTTANRKTFEYSGSKSLYETIDSLNSLFEDTFKEYQIWCRNDGSIVTGLVSKFKHFFPVGYVDINEADVFEKSISKNADASYKGMNVYGDSSASIKKAYAKIKSYPGWFLPPKKECHISIDEKLTSAKRTYYQDTYAKRLYNTGKGYTYKFSFNPAITPNDIARIVDGDKRTAIGIIKEVNHTFSLDDGYRTEIYVDSGGDYTVTEAQAAAYSIEAPGTSVTPVDAEVNTLDMYGVGRNQSILDLVQMNIGRAIK